MEGEEGEGRWRRGDGEEGERDGRVRKGKRSEGGRYCRYICTCTCIE